LTFPPFPQLLVVETPTVMVQDPLAGMEPPLSVTDEPPFTADMVPPHVVLALPSTINPLGNESVNEDDNFATELLGLLRVMVRFESPPG
jgi:hypothetical protein